MAASKKLAKRSYLSFFVIAGTAIVALAAVYLLLGNKSPSQDLQSKAAITGLTIPNGMWNFGCEGGTANCSESKWSASAGSTATYDTNAGIISFKVGKANATLTNNSSINLPAGKKKVTIKLSAPGLTSYKYAYQWKLSGDSAWHTTKKYITGDKFELPYSTTGKFTVTAQRIVFSGATVNQIINLDSVTWTVDAYEGNVEKVGTLYKNGAQTFLNENKKPFEITSLPSGLKPTDLQDWITNKQTVRVTGVLKYPTGVYDPTNNKPFIVASKIEATQEEIPMAADFKLDTWTDFGKSTDPVLTTREEGGNSLSFNVGDQASGKETTPSTGGVAVTGLNLTLGKTAKKLAFNLAVDAPDGVTPKFNLYLREKGKDWTKKAWVLDTTTKESMSYDVALTSNKVVLDGIKIEVTGAQWIDAETKGVKFDLNSLEAKMIKPAGKIYKEGTLDLANKTVNVKGDKLYYLNATLGDKDNLGNPLVDKMPVRVLGTLSYNDSTNVGKPVIKVNADPESGDYVQAMLEKVTFPQYTFEEGTEDWAGTNNQGLTQESGNLVVVTNSGTTSVNRTGIDTYLRAGAKTATVVLTAIQPSESDAAETKTFNLFINGKKYPLTGVPVSPKGAEAVEYMNDAISLGSAALDLKDIKLSFDGLKSGSTVNVDMVGISTMMGTGSVVKTGTITAKETAYANFKEVTKTGSCTLKTVTYQLVAEASNADSTAAFTSLTKGSRYTVVGVFDPEFRIPGLDQKTSPISIKSADGVMGSDPKKDASCNSSGGDDDSGSAAGSCDSPCSWIKDGKINECSEWGKDANGYNVCKKYVEKDKIICKCP